jgi:hypothetical protein
MKQTVNGMESNTLIREWSKRFLRSIDKDYLTNSRLLENGIRFDHYYSISEEEDDDSGQELFQKYIDFAEEVGKQKLKECESLKEYGLRVMYSVDTDEPVLVFLNFTITYDQVRELFPAFPEK